MRRPNTLGKDAKGKDAKRKWRQGKVVRMRAILSDIHGNLEALNAVLNDAHGFGVSEFFCLGDTLDYGPNPLECLDRVATFEVCLLGNSDEAVLFPPPPAAASAKERTKDWTRKQLVASSASAEANERLALLERLPRVWREPNLLMVHASPRSPLHEYIFPNDAQDRGKMSRIWPLIERWCFVGHTHIPGVFLPTGRFLPPSGCDGQQWKSTSDKTLINVGSVGQPRDGDSRASYVLFDGETVVFRRVAYDTSVTLEKIRATGTLMDPQVERWLTAAPALDHTSGRP